MCHARIRVPYPSHKRSSSRGFPKLRAHRQAENKPYLRLIRPRCGISINPCANLVIVGQLALRASYDNVITIANDTRRRSCFAVRLSTLSLNVGCGCDSSKRQGLMLVLVHKACTRSAYNSMNGASYSSTVSSPSIPEAESPITSYAYGRHAPARVDKTLSCSANPSTDGAMRDDSPLGCNYDIRVVALKATSLVTMYSYEYLVGSPLLCLSVCIGAFPRQS